MEIISKERLSMGSIGICKICGEKVWRSDKDGMDLEDGGVLHIRCFRRET